MTKARKLEYEIGSGNVLADLGLENADELLARAQLGHTVRLILKLMNGQYHLFAEGRLLAFLKSLDKKVTIQVSRHHKGEPYQQVTLAS
jgi:predicted XRE-type DNA-binding protein